MQEGGPEPPGCPGDGSQLSHFSDSGRQPEIAGFSGAGGARGPGTAVPTVERGSMSAATAGGHGQGDGAGQAHLPVPGPRDTAFPLIRSSCGREIMHTRGHTPQIRVHTRTCMVI